MTGDPGCRLPDHEDLKGKGGKRVRRWGGGEGQKVEVADWHGGEEGQGAALGVVWKEAVGKRIGLDSDRATVCVSCVFCVFACVRACVCVTLWSGQIQPLCSRELSHAASSGVPGSPSSAQYSSLACPQSICVGGVGGRGCGGASRIQDGLSRSCFFSW
jgi:hypothetical protein